MVVLPDPVGPTTRQIPYGLERIALNSLMLRSEKPIFSSGRGLLAARMRITMSSLPPEVGMVATRSSMVPIGPRKRILPSCGLRFSAMSSLDMILKRWTSALRCGAGTSRYFWQSPSMRSRTMVGESLPYGSMWMSEAPLL